MEQNTENASPKGKGHIGASVMYILIVGIAFAIMTAVFVFFPRTKYSELEKRDLAEFPDTSDVESIRKDPSKFTAAVSSWFSDTEPYRDDLMTLSMSIRGAMKGDFRSEEETVSFRPADTANTTSAQANESDKSGANSEDSDGSDNYDNSENTYNGEAPGGDDDEDDLNDGKAKLGSSGTIIIGKGDKVRALMAFGGSSKGGGGYVDLLNTLADQFPGKNVYAMVAPLATEYYLPEKAAKASKPQKPFIYSVRDRLSPKVKFVDIYDELLKHKKEDIYLRTDHHWAGLGGYYAAKRLAETAGVPFKGLDAYDRHEIKGFVGSMYGYSKDISVKNAPETFVYYTPNQVGYDAEFVTYSLNKNFKIVRESKPFKSAFFKKFKDGSGNAYLTFIGTDQAYVKVKTSTPGNRKVLIIKDSYGNAVPGNLFYSFNEVHVIDFRYFTHNLKDYINKNGITDIAVCFNVFNAYSSGSASKVKKMLTQTGGIPAVSDSDNKAKTTKKDNAPQVSIKTEDTSERPAPAQVDETPVQESEKTEPAETPASPEKTEEE
ncbi:MAG: hypothetical protein K2J58_06610 [Muribaculaceae bacterium]|nr:hypothetical protein [Muribaculaceae bacterium]